MTTHSSPTVVLFQELTFAASASHVHAEKSAANAGQSLARWTVLDGFSARPTTVPSVARRLRQTRQSTQRIADLLVDEGHLAKAANPDHLRSPLYELTPAGEKQLEELDASVSEWHAFVESRIEPKDLERLTTLLRSLRDVADDYTAE